MPANKKFFLKPVGIATFIFGSILLLSMIPLWEAPTHFHSEEELNYFKVHNLLDSPEYIDSSVIFPTSTNCSGCHGHDTQGIAMVDSEGNDVNTHDDWQTSMMANSAKDPFWRAKVSHEILVNPSHSQDLETKCTSCHAPQGHYTAILRGATHYSIAEMLADTTALDGVSCGVCHKISPQNLGTQFSGEITFDTARIVYGPYPNFFGPPMADLIGFQPFYSEHVNDAGLCASCHTLLTNSVDLDGQFTGEQFVEQATYHEWLNSDYDDDGLTPTTCQSCHMPRLEEEIIISANYLFLDGQIPYGLHDLVGGNTAMLQLMKDNKEALGIDAKDEHFDETISKTFAMLQEKSVDLEMSIDEIRPDTAFFSVEITNKAGHKFPSGYPARRAFVTFVITDELGDTLFQSGVLQADKEVNGQTADTEPHFNVINQENQVQIYELVLGDVNGDFTTVLERSHQALKDNRLPPSGFTTSHSTYDTTRIYGNALIDADFNYENGVEGTGSDIIHYHIPINGYNGLVNIAATMFYQSLPPKWMAPMFAESTPEIDAFRDMYNGADLSPVAVGGAFMENISFEGVATKNIINANWLIIHPNPTNREVVYLTKPDAVKIETIEIYNVMGQLIKSFDDDFTEIQLPANQQIYIIQVQTDRGRVVRKVIKY